LLDNTECLRQSLPLRAQLTDKMSENEVLSGLFVYKNENLYKIMYLNATYFLY
jgi:hypothetical protein